MIMALVFQGLVQVLEQERVSVQYFLQRYLPEEFLALKVEELEVESQKAELLGVLMFLCQTFFNLF